MSEKTLGAKKILVVEDDTFLLGLISGKLIASGYIALTATDGDQAIKTLEDETPDLVILDLVLPSTDGYEVLDKIKNSSKMAIPVFVFSNLSEEKDILKAKNMGAAEYMVKSSFTLDELMDKIKKLIG